MPGSATIPDEWEIASGSFSTNNEQDLRVDSPGEIVLKDPLILTDVAIVVRLFARKNVKFEIRGRRADTNNYVALSVNFENNLISLISTVSGVMTVKTQRYTFKTQGIVYYSIELWMIDTTIYGLVNGVDTIDTEVPLTTNTGASISVPEINSNDPITFAKFATHELAEHAERQLEKDPSNLLVLFRKTMQGQLESVELEGWTGYKKAMAFWRKHRNKGHRNQIWEDLGYPIEHPTTEDYLVD